MIAAQALIEKFRLALREKWGYIWGTAGEKWTETKQRQLEKTTDSNRAQGRKYGKKWIGHTVADCSGLFSWAFRQLGGTMYHGSDTMYRKWCTEKGELRKGKRTDCAALKPGTAVFVWNGSRYSHVGLFVGDETVIEAMGTINGVTTTKVTAGKWTHWGELTGVNYAGENAECCDRCYQKAEKPFDSCSMATVTQIEDLDSCSTMQNSELNVECKDWPMLRKGSKGESVKELQEVLERKGYSVGACGIDGKFGKDTLAAVKAFQKDHGLKTDGIVGPVTRKELMQE